MTALATRASAPVLHANEADARGQARVGPRTLAEWHRYVHDDARANDARLGPLVLIRRPIQRWLIALRTLEYLGECGQAALLLAGRLAVKLYFRRLSIRLGFTIPPGTCGPGLCLPHYGTIVVSGDARIGARCSIHPGVTIGSSRGQVPTIGTDVVLDPGAKLFGGVTMGDGSRAAANAVVTKDVPANAVAFGVPATTRPRR